MLAAGILLWMRSTCAEELDYFPLQVGNWWEYRWEHWNPYTPERPPEWALLRTEVGPTAQFAGREYLRLCDHFGFGVGDTLWVRAEGDQVWSWASELGEEFLWLDFGEQPEPRRFWSINARALGRVHTRDTTPWKWKVDMERRMGVDTVVVDESWVRGYRSSLEYWFPGQPGWIDHARGLEFSIREFTESPWWAEIYVDGIGPVWADHVWGWENKGQVILERAYVNGKRIDISTSVQPHDWGRIKRTLTSSD